MSSNNSSSRDIWGSFVPSPEIGVMWCVLLVLEALIITNFNVLTIATFVINSHLRRRSSYCIVNLAVADVLVGAVSVPLNVHVLGHLFTFWGRFEKSFIGFFYVQTTVHVFTGMASLFSLVLISLERMLAIGCPLRHRTTSNRMYVFSVGLTWMLSVIVAGIWICSLIYFQHEVSLYVWMPSLLVSLLVICTAYVGVYVAVIHHKSNQQNPILKTSFKKEKELAVTLFIVTAVSLASWIPFAVVQVMNFKDNVTLSFNVIYAAIAIANANSFINPVIYVFRMQSFRRALVKLITKCSRDRPSKNVNSRNTRTDLFISPKKSTQASSMKTVATIG